MKTHICISCGNKFSGNYCNICGEKVIRREDRKLKHFAGEFVNALTFADSKFWRTFKYIIFKPGKFSRDFIDGKRNAYMKPISVFFFANLIYFIFPLFNTFNNTLQSQLKSRSFIHSTLANDLVNEEIEARDITFESYAVKYNAKTSELSKLLLIIMVLFMASFFALIHTRSGFLMADHVVINLELMTFVILIAIQFQGAIIYLLRNQTVFFKSEFLRETLISSIGLLMLAYFSMKMERTFYQVGKWRAVLNTVLCIVSFVIVLYLYRAILFFVTFWSI